MAMGEGDVFFGIQARLLRQTRAQGTVVAARPVAVAVVCHLGERPHVRVNHIQTHHHNVTLVLSHL
jgi:hypothetical protein